MSGTHTFFAGFLKNRQIRFLLLGGANFIFSLAFILGLQRLFGNLVSPQIIYLAGTFLCSIQSYFAMRIIVFKSRENWFFEYMKYFSTVVVNCIFGVVLLTCMVELLDMDIYLAQCLNMMVIVVLVYVLLKIFVFRGVFDPGSPEKFSDR